jgi:hypothetical protein
MENYTEAEVNKKIVDIDSEIQPALYKNTPKEPVTEDNPEKELNAKILKITMMIREQHPELSKYLEEMPVTMPDEKHPEITVVNLMAYYDSLKSLLNKYELEHPA